MAIFRFLSVFLLAVVAGCTDGQTGFSNPLSRERTGGTGFSLFDNAGGERWTIECMLQRGPKHVEIIDRYAQLLRETPGIKSKQVKVIHEDDASSLYYGRYQREPGSRGGRGGLPPEMDRDIRFIRQLALKTRQRPFASARRVLEPMPDVGPPEWDLRKADGYYSLQIAVFYNQGEFRNRKLAAVEYCKYWREKGYDAFYYHGSTRSSTTVGLFPEDAVKTIDGRPEYAQKVLDLRTKEPEFAWNLENGSRIYIRRAPDNQRIPQRSMLVKVPKETERFDF